MSFMKLNTITLLTRVSKIIRSECVIVPTTNLLTYTNNPNAFQVRNYAARKGTRARKEKKKVKKEEQKVGFIPHNLRDREKMLAMRASLIVDDTWKKPPIDDVFCTKYFHPVLYPFEEAVKCHMETHHPSMYNVPDAPLYVDIELNMQAEKKNRFIDNFTRIVAIPHTFERDEERSVIVFAKDSAAQEEAKQSGANLVGGVELVKQIQAGTLDLQEFQFVVAHPDILPDLVVLRGLMKKKFPNPKQGTLDVDVGSAVTRLLHGISYSAKKDEHQKEFGLARTIIGNLTMTPKQLEENFIALIRDIHTMKGKKDVNFIRRVLLTSPPSREKLQVDPYLYIVDDKNKAKPVDEEEEAGERIAL